MIRLRKTACDKAQTIMCLGSDIPKPPPPPPPPQQAKAPDTTPLKRRNANAGGIAMPAGSTMLTGPNGVSNSQLNLGSNTLLGGGTGG